jgi:DHA1 family bicyclomycin/chloramphenicol resistance-like MFS transporter
MAGRELVAFLAMAIALSALGIDLLLPAFPEIRAEFGLPLGSTTVSRFITAYFVGLAGGQLIIGPLADRFGRRALFRAGIVLYIIGAALTFVAPTFTTLLVARLLWGLGAATGRVLAVAIVRDRFAGAAMARTISLIMAVFITVPIFAPSAGVLLLRFMAWDQLVLINLAAAAVMLVWTTRLEETLAPEDRRQLRTTELRDATLTVLRHPSSGPLIAAQAVLFGGFASYLSTSEVVYREVFDSEALFPFLLGGMALLMGFSSLVNGRIVERVGLARMLRIDLVGYLAGAGALVVVAIITGGEPPLAVYVAILVVLLSSHAVLIPNLNAQAMEPMGSIAGTASAINGSVLIGGGALIGSVIDRAYDGTILPLATAMAAIGLVTAGLLRQSDRRLSGTGAQVPGRSGDRPHDGRPSAPHDPS